MVAFLRKKPFVFSACPACPVKCCSYFIGVDFLIALTLTFSSQHRRTQAEQQKRSGFRDGMEYNLPFIIDSKRHIAPNSTIA
jgi:hypothetical protein